MSVAVTVRMAGISASARRPLFEAEGRFSAELGRSRGKVIVFLYHV